MDKKGLTLIELMVTMIILSIVVLSVGTILTSSWRFWNSGWGQVKLQTDTSYAFAAIEKVIRSGSSTDTGGSSLTVTKEDIDTSEGLVAGWTKTFQLNGDVLQLVEGGNTEDIIDGVSSINFSPSESTVLVNLVLQEGDSRTDFRTTVFLRNSL